MSSGVSTKPLLVIYIYNIYYISLVIYIYITIIPTIFQLDVYYISMWDTRKVSLLFGILSYFYIFSCIFAVEQQSTTNNTFRIHTHFTYVILNPNSKQQSWHHHFCLLVRKLGIAKDKELDIVKVTLKSPLLQGQFSSTGQTIPLTTAYKTWNYLSLL